MILWTDVFLHLQSCKISTIVFCTVVLRLKNTQLLILLLSFLLYVITGPPTHSIGRGQTSNGR